MEKGLGLWERQVQAWDICGESDSTVCHHLEAKSETLALQKIIKFAAERNYLVEVLFPMVCWRARRIGSYRS